MCGEVTFPAGTDCRARDTQLDGLQVRQPVSVVAFLAERLDLPALLRLQLPEGGQPVFSNFY